MKKKSRKFCFFHIKASWSILNQIMISLLIITLGMLIWISSQVFIGLYVSKYYFLQFSKDSIIEQANGLFTYEAQQLQSFVINNTQYSQNGNYELNTNQIVQDVADFIWKASQNNSLFVEYNVNNQSYYFAGDLNQTNNYTNCVVVIVPESEIINAGQILAVETNSSFSQNFNYTIYMIVGSFVLIMSIGCAFAYYIVRPLKLLAEYAQHINYNTTKLSYGRQKNKKVIELKNIRAEDKIGNLIDEFKNLIQGFAGMKKGNISKTQIIKPFLQGNENQNQKEFLELMTLVDRM